MTTNKLHSLCVGVARVCLQCPAITFVIGEGSAKSEPLRSFPPPVAQVSLPGPSPRAVVLRMPDPCRGQYYSTIHAAEDPSSRSSVPDS